MAALRGAQSCGEVIQHACRGPAVMRLLLLAGVETGGLWRGDLLFPSAVKRRQLLGPGR
jgi:hypothetical protein